MSTTPAYRIRRATPADAAAIAACTVDMAMETEGRQLDAAHMHRGVLCTFEPSCSAEYYLIVSFPVPTVADEEAAAAACEEVSNHGAVVQEEKEECAGFMMTAPFFTLRGACPYTRLLQTVYVAPPHRRRGLFRRCYEFLRDLAEADPLCAGIELYVEEANATAQEAYRAMGMEKENRVMMRWSKCGY